MPGVPIPDIAREKLADCLSITSLPIQWGDQDAFGHVNNVVYFRWLESARIDLMNQFQSAVGMNADGYGPILASIRCDYRRQLHFPDIVHVGSAITRIGRSSIEVRHAVYSEQLMEIAATAVSILVVFDYPNNRPVRIPDQLREQILPHCPDPQQM